MMSTMIRSWILDILQFHKRSTSNCFILFSPKFHLGHCYSSIHVHIWIQGQTIWEGVRVSAWRRRNVQTTHKKEHGGWCPTLAVDHSPHDYHVGCRQRSNKPKSSADTVDNALGTGPWWFLELVQTPGSPHQSTFHAHTNWSQRCGRFEIGNVPMGWLCWSNMRNHMLPIISFRRHWQQVSFSWGAQWCTRWDYKRLECQWVRHAAYLVNRYAVILMATSSSEEDGTKNIQHHYLSFEKQPFIHYHM